MKQEMYQVSKRSEGLGQEDEWGTGGFKLSSAWFTSEERFSVLLSRCIPLCPLSHYINELKYTSLIIYQKKIYCLYFLSLSTQNYENSIFILVFFQNPYEVKESTSCLSWL